MTQRFGSALAAAAFILAAAGPLAGQDPGEQLRPGPDESNTRVGTRGANFLEIGVGARATALGGAYGALSEGASALYWNPAGIARDPMLTAMFSYSDLYGDFGIDHFFGGVTLPSGEGAFGVHIISLSSGEIPRTTEAFPEGGDPAFGATFEWTSLAIGFSYARQITDRLVVGATLKYAQTGIDDAKANFLGGDAGVQFRTGLLGTTLSASLLNLGSDGEFSGSLLNQIVGSGSEFFPTGRTLGINLDTRGWDMPTVFAFSVMWDLLGSPEAILAPNPIHTVQLVTDAVDAIDTAIQARVGVEYGYREIFFLRAGKFWPNEEGTGEFHDFSYGLSGGFGIAVPIAGSRLKIDYAYTDRGLLDNIQVFSVEYASR